MTADERSGQLLNDREQQVLELLADGYTSHTIAVMLQVTDRTVGRRVASMLDRLDAYTIAHAVAIAYRRGVLNATLRQALPDGYGLQLVRTGDA